MLRSRIARRVLAEQHIALTTQYHDTLEHGPLQDSHRYIGIIDTSLSPYESIKALEDILPQVTGFKNTKIVIDGKNAKDIRFAFINDHIQFIVFELMKNSIIAAVKSGIPNKAERIYVTLSETPNLIGVRVSDECESLEFIFTSTLFDCTRILTMRLCFIAGGISPEYQPPVYSKDDRPLVSASRSGLLHFAHPYHKEYLPVFRNTPRLGATIQEQLGPEADERLGIPGKRVQFGLSLGLCKVYAEVGHIFSL